LCGFARAKPHNLPGSRDEIPDERGYELQDHRQSLRTATVCGTAEWSGLAAAWPNPRRLDDGDRHPVAVALTVRRLSGD
jgi:hypothetical protein